jgi:glycosyltransferase involved in cell wall biosynthesis
MKNLLYIGNKLNNESSNITTIDTLGNHLVDEGFNVSFSSSMVNKVFRLFDMIFTVVKNSKKVDFVLIDTYSTLNFYYAFIISQVCRLLKLKYIPILHGGDLPNRLNKNPKLSKAIFNNALKNVSPSIYLKEKFHEFGVDNIEYIPNSIEVNYYPYCQKKIEKPKLFWLRSFKKIYNPLMAIKVAKNLKDRGIDCELCMVGPDGDGSFLFAQKLSRELKIDVNFKLKMRKEDWINLSKEYNIFLNTTDFDNMPVSVIEAMALGFPIVSTNPGGMPSLITNGEDGLLVEKDDVDGMADHIIKLKNDPELANNLSKKARAKAEKFNWEVIKENWNTLLS